MDTDSVRDQSTVRLVTETIHVAGDLGRRILEHRHELNFTLARVDERVGIAMSYLESFEPVGI
jgi:hypothetical protein